MRGMHGSPNGAKNHGGMDLEAVRKWAKVQTVGESERDWTSRCGRGLWKSKQDKYIKK